MGLNSESSSHSQAMVASDTGVVHGSSTRKRTIHLPRKSCTSTRARALASTTTSTMATTVMKTVWKIDCRKVWSERMAR